ncbi:MAG TPA: DHHA2 domain-containing protein [Spirochaetia bacterium]|nr:DHHA2 domain-containing protein [Spirochaetia bacterium]
MARKQKPLLVIGHKNPDTDSICAALTYARLKTEVFHEEAAPRRAGNVNPQTQFVLSRFETDSPPLITDVRSRIEDIMIPREELITLAEEDTLQTACDLLTANRFSFLPVIDRSGKCLGKLTALKLVSVLRRLVATCRDDEPIGETDRNLLAGTISALVDRDHTTFPPDAVVKDVLRAIGKSNEGGFIIMGESKELDGVITRVSFINESRLRVVMVDHNEVGQAVDGIEEADIQEIIDHHRLGARTTSLPITFINRVVGSTCTIIADLYRTAGATPPRRDAGLMLSAMLSDTIILRSPTTTALDREIASWLAGLCRIDIETYGSEMFAAGSSLEGMDPKKIMERDRKVYSEGERKFSLSQFETVGFGPILDMKDALGGELERIMSSEGCSFACLMITDVSREMSLLLCRGEPRVIGAISYPRREENLFEMKDVLSRKKQLLPYFVDLLKTL